MLDRQEGYLTVEGCGGAAEHTATLYHLPDLTAVAARLRPLAEQVGAVSLMTAQLAAQALAYQFAAHLVHSPVGEREQQYRRAFLHELFLQHVDHAEGGLTRAGRSDDEEEVPGLFHAQHQVVELRVALAGVVALECERGVDPRLALQQEQVLAFLTGFEEELKTLIKSTTIP